MTTPNITELSAPLKKSGFIVLDANGNGVIEFTPDNAWQRWEVTSVIVSTNQPSVSAIVPTALAALNTVDPTTMSQGNVRGGMSWSGNNDTLSGELIDVGPADNFSVVFQPPAGQAGAAAALAGVIASAVVTGTKYTRRS
jgi:hypothetical protein